MHQKQIKETKKKMLEGAVARLLNQLLGKYIVDLDTENLNVGIFSGHVQLTDLKLKTEALVRLSFVFFFFIPNNTIAVRIKFTYRDNRRHDKQNMASNTVELIMESTRRYQYRRRPYNSRSDRQLQQKIRRRKKQTSIKSV